MATIITDVGGTKFLNIRASGQADVQLVGPSGDIALLNHLTDTAAIVNKVGIPIGGWSDGNFKVLKVSHGGRMALGDCAPLLYDNIEGTTMNTQMWTSTAVTFVNAQTATGINLDSTSLTTANAVNVLTSNKQFAKIDSRATLCCEFRARIATVTNSVAEIGFGNPAGTAANVNGAYWRYTSGGAVQPVFTFNSVDTTGTDVSSLLNNANYYNYIILCGDDTITYIVQNTATGRIISEQTIQVPATQAKVWTVTHLPAFGRVYNTATPPGTAPIFLLTSAYIYALDVNATKSWQHIMACGSRSSLVNPTLFTQAAQFANSAEPASAALSNTVPGYTTLGGKYQFAAVAGAVTDWALFGYAVPAPYQLIVTKVIIDTWNVGAAVTTTPTLLTWGIGTNGASGNLATGAHIRHTLGCQSFLVAAPIGAAVAQINRSFEIPIVCEAGKTLDIILRMPVGSATASQIIAGMVSIEGYFE